MIRHLARFGHQLVGVNEAVQVANFIHALGGEAKRKRNLGRNGLRQVIDDAMAVAAQQPAFGLGGFKRDTTHGNT